MAKDLHTFTGEEVIATEVPQYLNQNFSAIPNNLGVWEANEAVSVGDTRILNGRENAGYVLECTKAGTTGTTQPTITDSDITDGTDINGLSGVLSIAGGGTNASDATTARANLGLSYASQTEAEAGTDNTKVMTPLRVKEAITTIPNMQMNSTNIGAFGNKTVADLQNALKQWVVNNANKNAIGVFQADVRWVGLWENNDTTSIISTGNGNLWTIKPISVYSDPTHCALEISSYLGISQSRVVVTLQDDLWVSIQRVAYNGALSMPSNNNVTISTSATSYTAPADGWVSILCEVPQNLSYAYIYLRNGNIRNYQSASPTYGFSVACLVPCAKGNNITWDTNLTIKQAHFIYAQSEV